MGDYLLDLRPSSARTLPRVADDLRFVPALRTTILEEPDFGLVLSDTGCPELWAPFRGEDGLLVAVAGRVAFDAAEWAAAAQLPGPGGTACKAIHARFRRAGVDALLDLNGNAVVIVHDPSSGLLHLVTDCSGVFPTFECATPEGPVYASHPDVLAASAHEEHRLDETSLSEFLLCSTVSPPFTFYERIRATPHATLLTFDLRGPSPRQPTATRCFEFTFQGNPAASETEVAEELAAALRQSVARRTLPHLGPAAVALSGGLDSRALLSCAQDPEHTFAFTCFDQPNPEFHAAEAVARHLGIRFVPLQRPPEYYAEHAELGVRISGGMGTFANNHFLGVLDRLHAEGMRHMLTGCYFDYLFKGLPLNRTSSPLSGRERLAPFRPQFYFGHRSFNGPHTEAVRERWEDRIPGDLRSQDSPEKIFQIEVRRTFPLCYEGDNQQRLVPQRVTGWYLPVADREVLTVYRRIPSLQKLNRSVFLKAFLRLQQPAIRNVRDANTRLRPGASPLREAVVSHYLRLQRRLRRLKPSLSTDTSWPDWAYFVRHSALLRTLWQRPNPDALDLLRRLAGPDCIRRDPEAYQGSEVFLFVALLTLKLWLDQRSR